LSYQYARKRKAVNAVQRARSLRAKRIYAGLRAPIAKTAEQWVAPPNRFDLPDMDIDIFLRFFF
jgi:hypothetical protein